jgi:predicted small integral membrane protein
MELRLAKVALVAALAAFALVVAYDNIVDYDSNYQFVRHVLSMDTTFPGNALMGRAITDERVWRAAYATIIVAEGLTGLLLAAGALRMVLNLKAPAAAFERAKGLVYLGGALAFLVWFFGFMVVAGEYFAMWQSRDWNGQAAAFRIYTAVLGVLILLALPEREVG